MVYRKEVNKLKKDALKMTRSDIQGVAQAIATSYGADDEEILREINDYWEKRGHGI